MKAALLLGLAVAAAGITAVAKSAPAAQAETAASAADAQLAQGFACPDANASPATRRAELRAFAQRVRSVHPDWRLPQLLAFRQKMMQAHACEGPQGEAELLGKPVVHKVDTGKLPPGTKVVSDVHYGPDELDTFDVYAPPHAADAPVIFMVHGGGWRRGDKTAWGVVQHKVEHWVPMGFVVISVDYPLLPTPPLQQAQRVAKALATAQKQAAEWGANPREFVLMGHSAGAHLVSLIGAKPSLATSQGALPWLGTVALDSAAYNLVSIMQAPHFDLYDQAFGADRATWTASSPTLQLTGKIAPLLGVCSSKRKDSCAQARAFQARARGLGATVEVLPEDLQHGAINEQLGTPSAYTQAVDHFLAGLSPALAARLEATH